MDGPTPLAIWDTNTTAVFTGIAAGIIGIIGTACASLFTQIKTSSMKVRADERAKDQEWDRARADKLEQRVWEIEKELKECTKESSRWKARFEDLEALHTEVLKSIRPPKEPT